MTVDMDDSRLYDADSKCWRDMDGYRTTDNGGVKKGVPKPPGIPESGAVSKGELTLRRSVSLKQSKYMDWLVSFPDSRKPETQSEWAEENGTTVRTLKRWEIDPTFRREWLRRLDQVGHSPEKRRQVMHALYVAATDPLDRNVQAMKLWMDYTEKVMPPHWEHEEEPPPSVSDLSDDDLLSALEALKEAHEMEVERRG